MMKVSRFCTVMLTICLITGLTVPASAMIIKRNGRCISIEQFRKSYANTNGAADFDNNSTMYFESVQYEESTLKMSVTIDSPVYKDTVEMVGVLLLSHKQRSGIDSYVGELTASNKELKILHFEVFNSNRSDISYATEEYYTKPHIKMYCLYRNNVLLFETDIPQEVQSILSKKEIKDYCLDSLTDGMWFAYLLEGVTETKMTRPPKDSQPKGLGSYVDQTVSTSYVYMGNNYTQYIVFRTVWSYANVNTDSAHEWSMGLKILEAYTIDPYGQRIDCLGINIREMRYSFACGDTTRFVERVSSGDYYDLYGIGSLANSISGLLGAILDAAVPPSGGVGALIAAVIAVAHSSASFPTNGTQITLSYTDACRALDFQYPTRYYLINVNHKLEHVCKAKADNIFQSGSSGNRTGEIRVSYKLTYAGSTVSLGTVSSGEFSYYCDMTP